jgi:transcriptional regulator with XRE-family HTH domain
MNRIANGLKKQRENSGKSVKQVVTELQRYGIVVSDKTVYSWESGKRMPDGSSLLALCDIYGTKEILSAFGYKEPSTEAEGKNKALEVISQLSPADQEYIIELARRFAKQQ